MLVGAALAARVPALIARRMVFASVRVYMVRTGVWGR